SAGGFAAHMRIVGGVVGPAHFVQRARPILERHFFDLQVGRRVYQCVIDTAATVAEDRGPGAAVPDAFLARKRAERHMPVGAMRCRAGWPALLAAPPALAELPLLAGILTGRRRNDPLSDPLVLPGDILPEGGRGHGENERRGCRCGQTNDVTFSHFYPP